MNTAKTRARPHHLSDPVTCSCHQGRFDPGNTEPFILKTFRVLILSDRWDEDSDRPWIAVKAFGPADAANQVRLDYPNASVLWTELAP
jgi:hypothetical protein